MNINFNNKSLVFPQIIVYRGRSTKRELLGTSENGETVIDEVKITETVLNKTEAERVSKFESKARQALLKHTTPGPKGMHLIDSAAVGALKYTLTDLIQSAADLNAGMTVCKVQVDCLIIPVEITLDSSTADKMRQHIQGMLTELKQSICQPDPTLNASQRYSKARSQYYACTHLVDWVTGVNVDIVRYALEEAADKCADCKTNPPADLEQLERAIRLFDPVAEFSFAEIPF